MKRSALFTRDADLRRWPLLMLLVFAAFLLSAPTPFASVVLADDDSSDDSSDDDSSDDDDCDSNADCDDGDLCTRDLCDEEAEQCVNFLLQCCPDGVECNPDTGQCEEEERRGRP